MRYHDDSDPHLLWDTDLRNDFPKSIVDSQLDYDKKEPTGVAFTNGAPGTENAKYVEESFGVMIAADEFRSGSSWDFHGLQSVTMHELGHALGIGYADDTAIELGSIGVIDRGMEVYSGDVGGDEFEGDTTPERIKISQTERKEWSIMKSGTAEDTRQFSNVTADIPILAISIEESSTGDLNKIPSKTE